MTPDPLTHRPGPGRRRPAGAWLWLVVACLFFGIVGIAAFVLPSNLVAAILAGGAVILVWLLLPEAVIITLLLARGSVDGFMELFTLFSGSPLSMNLSGLTNSLAVGLGVLTLLRRLLRRQPLLVSAPGWTYALFLLICMLSIGGSVDPATSIKEWARLASGWAIYLMVADAVRDERKARRYVVVMMASSLAPLALAWYQAFTGSGYFFLGFVGTEFAYRPQGTFGHPSILGTYLIVLLTVAMGLYFSTTSAKIKAVLLAWASAAVGALVLTLARTQWLGMVVAAVVIGLFKRLRLAVLALVVTAVLVISIPLVRERLTASESVTWRVELWQAGLTLAWPPTLLGKGLATFPWYINQILPKMDVPPHNDYLKVAAELGLFGMVTYLLWVLALVRHGWRAYRWASNPVVAWRALGLLAVTFAIIVMSVTDNQLDHTAVQWYFWALVALVPAQGRWPEADR